jgi:hypothetical protein
MLQGKLDALQVDIPFYVFSVVIKPEVHVVGSFMISLKFLICPRNSSPIMQADFLGYVV